MTQPEALRLADLLEMGSIWQDQEKAAIELRRLHAENEALREANEAFGKRQEWWNEKMFAIERLRAALVASRVIPPEAVEDSDAYDDGVMLGRIEALYGRIT